MSAVPQLPRDFPEPQKNSAVTTATRWDKFLGEIAAGTKLEDAMMKTNVSRADIETFTRLNDLELARWNEARVAGRKRSWSILDFEEVFARVAAGAKVDDAVMAVRGVSALSDGFYHLVNSDPQLFTMYRKAKEACALGMGEELMDIIDDDSNDTLAGPKGGEIPNMAAVTRSKLRFEGRFRYMGAYHSKLFGEKKDSVQVNVQINHAERLEAAREREKLRDKRPKPISRDIVEAAFTEVPPTPSISADTDTTWMDEKPTDAVWREES